MCKTNLGEKLKAGELTLIAEITGYALSTVSLQLHGKRTLKDKVAKAAWKVIKNRERLFKNN